MHMYPASFTWQELQDQLIVGDREIILQEAVDTLTLTIMNLIIMDMDRLGHLQLAAEVRHLLLRLEHRYSMILIILVIM